MPPSFFQCRLCGFVNFARNNDELERKLKAHFVKSHGQVPDLCSVRTQKHTVIGHTNGKDGRWRAVYSSKNISPLREDWKEFKELNARLINCNTLPDRFPLLSDTEQARLADLEAEFAELPYRTFRCSRTDVDEFAALHGEAKDLFVKTRLDPFKKDLMRIRERF